MKRRKLEYELSRYGWFFLRHGGNHDIWTNGNEETMAFARHPDINEITAKAMIRKAKNCPG